MPASVCSVLCLFFILSFLPSWAVEATRSVKIFDGQPKKLVVVHNGNGPYTRGQFIDRIQKMPGSEGIELSEKKQKAVGLNLAKNRNPEWFPKEPYPEEETIVYFVQSFVGHGTYRLPGKKPVRLDSTKCKWNDETKEQGMNLMLETLRRLLEYNVDVVFMSDTFWNHLENMGHDSHQGWHYARNLVHEYNKNHKELAHIHPAIDTQTETEKIHPYQLTFDLYHPSFAGHETIAHDWFSALCAYDGLEVPAWSKEWRDKEVAKERSLRATIKSVEAKVIEVNGEPHLQVDYVCDPDKVKQVDIRMSLGCCFIHKLKLVQKHPVSADGVGTFTYKMADLKQPEDSRFWKQGHRVMVSDGRRKYRNTDYLLFKYPGFEAEKTAK